PSYT
ncbi:LOW QUALITY PROTEIN: hypothetical protein ECJG_04678, partial [Escherichia coli M718]